MFNTVNQFCIVSLEFYFLLLSNTPRVVILGQEFLSVHDRNLTLHGEKVFLAGINQAWFTYGADFGYLNYACSKQYLMNTLDVIMKSGGNSIRMWVHTSGQVTPVFNATGFVIGPGPNCIRDMLDFAQEARKRNILVTFTLWNCAVLQSEFNITGLLFNETKLQSYITNALIPIVDALKTERGVGIWEIINEPEGCVQTGIEDKSEPCFDTSTLHSWDFADWTHSNIPLKNLLRFISLQANAIHVIDPKALVTVGSWTYKSLTNQLNRRNFYSDECLIYASGGLQQAKLDLYQIHTYDTLGIFLPHDPFMVHADVYSFDKPVIIGEFSQKRGGFKTSPELFTWAYYHGYSGSWSWSALGSDSAADTLPVQEQGLLSLKEKNDQANGGRVNINLQFLDIIGQLGYFVIHFLSYFKDMYKLPCFIGDEVRN